MCVGWCAIFSVVDTYQTFCWGSIWFFSHGCDCWSSMTNQEEYWSTIYNVPLVTHPMCVGWCPIFSIVDTYQTFCWFQYGFSFMVVNMLKYDNQEEYLSTIYNVPLVTHPMCVSWCPIFSVVMIPTIPFGWVQDGFLSMLVNVKMTNREIFILTEICW